MQAIFSSNSAHKLKEVELILNNFEVQSYRMFLGEMEILESGASFEENACLKARVVYDLLQESHRDLCVLADDSGLCVEALGGMPGIYSARFAAIKEGVHAIIQRRFILPKEDLGDTCNNLKLLACLQELGLRESRASFVCVVGVCARIGGQYYQKSFKGECKGKVIQAPLNPQAFGYDPLFIPEGYNLSLDRLEKNAISHRFLALRQCREFLQTLSQNKE
ncbi:non-canonical purine NTP pyrophosphatase [Helicobacter labacensis]|uniref:non-canonical purine NTP pyrophosphatase n=1 Tax=Helicobacter labacensis TaxID=2316079 RepID=UPI000EB0C14C|nr:non-canonical purine NTP pyrophosphatase [Helicobacter labacensis]